MYSANVHARKHLTRISEHKVYECHSLSLLKII